MIVAIVGSRGGLPWARVRLEIRELVARPEVTGVVSGGAGGVDSIARAEAIAAGKPLTEFLADWKTYGKRAGFVRNPDIVAAVAEVHAWWNGTSRGTAHTIELARKAGKPVHVHRYDGEGTP